MSLPGYHKSNACIVDGEIHNSSIDMDGGVITNHGTPVDPLDVVNLAYLDTLEANLPSVIITLTGTAYTTILNVLRGTYTISVTNIIVDGPCATFMISKNQSNRYPSFMRLNSHAGETTLERLELQWNPTSGIQLKKNGPAYDGTYKIVYLANA
ncbi:hypothetical protein CCP3SC1AL1_690003 [Gammaproteobacteria bacterium]